VPDPAPASRSGRSAALDHDLVVRAGFDEHVRVARRAGRELAAAIAELAADLVACLSRGGKLVVFGNGGSAADAQHFAAELVGRYRAERPPLPAVALTTDTSVLTAIANDFDYGDVFARQVQALCSPGDLAVGISTSGRSESILRGLQAARERGARAWALTGGDGGPLLGEADAVIVVPSATTARIQEMHELVIHLVCDVVDAWAAGDDDEQPNR
jgi:D-sedoheptulose 7-phosphate isomerase